MEYVEARHPGLLDFMEESLDHLGDPASDGTKDDDGVRREPLGSPVEWTEEETYFFRLSAYQDKLLDLYARVPDFVLPREQSE